MPRRPVENNNWAALGELVLKYWKGELSEEYIKENLQTLLPQHGCVPDKNASFEAHFDSDTHLHVVFPSNPWTVDQLKTIEQIEAYKRELGIIVMGGCK